MISTEKFINGYSYLASMIMVSIDNFEYFEPEKLDEAVSILRKYKGECRVLAGGTDLIGQMKKGKISPKQIMSIRKLPLEFIKKENGLLRIGAMTKLRAIEESTLIRKEYASICEAAYDVGPVQLRNVGTIGGNICRAYIADMALPLLTLDAQMVLTGPRGSRVVPIREFFVGSRQSVLNDDELLTEIRIGDFKNSRKTTAFLKLCQRPASLTISVATALFFKDNLVERCEIAIGGVAPIPAILKKSKETIENKLSIEENSNIEPILQQVKKAVIEEVRTPDEYKKAVSGVLVERVMKKALERVIL